MCMMLRKPMTPQDEEIAAMRSAISKRQQRLDEIERRIADALIIAKRYQGDLSRIGDRCLLTEHELSLVPWLANIVFLQIVAAQARGELRQIQANLQTLVIRAQRRQAP